MTSHDGRSAWPYQRLVTAALVFLAATALSTLTLLAVRWVAGPPANTAAGGDGLGFVRIDKPARPLSLPSLRGHETIDLAKLAGKPIVMNFWSSMCPPCKEETPAITRVARALGGKVNFLGVDSADLQYRAIDFVTKYKVPYQIAVDASGSTTDSYGVLDLPVTLFLSPSGKTVLGENFGALTSHELRVILRRLYHVS